MRKPHINIGVGFLYGNHLESFFLFPFMPAVTLDLDVDNSPFQ